MLYVKQFDFVQFDIQQNKRKMRSAELGEEMKKKYVGMEIRALDNLIKRLIENSINKERLIQVTGSNGWIIGYLWENREKDIYQKDLESEFHVTRSTASKVVNLMVEKGLIVRENVHTDARLKKLVLTEKAIKMAEEMEEGHERIERQIIKGFSKEELKQFYSYLERLKKNVEQEEQLW